MHPQTHDPEQTHNRNEGQHLGILGLILLAIFFYGLMAFTWLALRAADLRSHLRYPRHPRLKTPSSLTSLPSVQGDFTQGGYVELADPTVAIIHRDSVMSREQVKKFEASLRDLQRKHNL